MARAEKSAPVTLGSPRFSTLECRSFLVTDAIFPARHTLAAHFHDRSVLGITLSGEWDSMLGATRLANSPGTLHIEPAGECHVNHFGNQGAHVIVIQPDHEDAALLQPFLRLLETPLQSRVGPAGILLAQRLRRELLQPDDLTPIAVESLALDLLISASRLERIHSGPSPAWLIRTAEYVRARFLEQPTLVELATVAGVSADHLNREFRRVYRVGVAEYLRRLRLEWAAERLRKTRESLVEIAAAAGFADQSHFTRRFRRQFGITPAVFRAGFRSDHAANVTSGKE